MNSKQKSLNSIIRIMAEEHLTVEDISAAIEAEKSPESLGLYLCQRQDGQYFECYYPQLTKDDKIIAFQFNEGSYERFLCQIVGESHEQMEELCRTFCDKHGDRFDIKQATIWIIHRSGIRQKLQNVNRAMRAVEFEELRNLHVVEYDYEDFIRAGFDDDSCAAPYFSVDNLDISWANVDHIKSTLLTLRWRERE